MEYIIEKIYIYICIIPLNKNNIYVYRIVLIKTKKSNTHTTKLKIIFLI